MEEYNKTQPGGRIVGKRYELIQEIGRGGMARVWLAREADAGTERWYAIKEPVDAEPGKISRFYREARAHWLLRDSPYIVRMHGFEHPEHTVPYLVLELMQGGSLKDLMVEFARHKLEHDRLESGMPRELALKLAWQAVSALWDLHQKDFAHRDLKPSNLLLQQRREQILETKDGTLKLSDLGIIDEESFGGPDDTQVGGMVGTWQYAPPEYLKSLADKHDLSRDTATAKRGDLYSLGLILYEIWMGSPLYRLQPSKTNSQSSTADRAQHVLVTLEKGLSRLKAADHTLREDDEIYALVPRMLDRIPANRPPIDEVEGLLRGLLKVVPSATSTISATSGSEAPPMSRALRISGGLARSVPRRAVMAAVPVSALLLGWWLRGSQAISPALQDTPIAALPAHSQPVPAATPATPGSAAATSSSVTESSHLERQSDDRAEPSKIESLPVLSEADRAFVDALKRTPLKPARPGAPLIYKDDQSLLIKRSSSSLVSSPGQVTRIAHSTNTSLPYGQATIGVLLRHGDSHYYSIVKGFNGQPGWLKRYASGQKIGVRDPDEPVSQQLVFIEAPVRRWADLNSAKVVPIPPQLWLETAP